MPTVSIYDLDGKLLWSLKGMSSITIATPYEHGGLLYVTSGYVLDQKKPIFAIRPGAQGDISLKGTTFTNDGPEIVVPVGMVELEVPMILRGQWVASNGGFELSFPMAEFAPRACAQIAILRKCFELKELRASANQLELDFDNEMVDRRFTF